jgi:hypothetical protein
MFAAVRVAICATVPDTRVRDLRMWCASLQAMPTMFRLVFANIPKVIRKKPGYLKLVKSFYPHVKSTENTQAT